MFCHGELARLKPAPRYLTRFYLMVSAGGAFGSALVGLVAPLVLPAYFELAFGLTACAALLAFQVRRRHWSLSRWRSWRCLSRSAREHGKSRTSSTAPCSPPGIFTGCC